ncbi:hypothetical protein CPB83DRAFT_853555 [Crepidotus variabilis]|uniref:Secreted protein n=1 Tax=Crepidotus variabilis TaxID=179855 RepID=A0A9P6EHF1_9AGAR|nr:hypothetical protein CPB83DRAFT_853555 [Crepidotus variabilis]
MIANLTALTSAAQLHFVIALSVNAYQLGHITAASIPRKSIASSSEIVRKDETPSAHFHGRETVCSGTGFGAVS